MKNKKIRILSVTMGLVVFLTGCGTQMHEITDEERHIIAEAAASFVAKYNTYQKDGMNSSVLDEDTIEEQENQETEESGQDDGTDTKQNNSAAGEDNDKSELQVISLSEAIKCNDNITVKYNGYKLDDTYQEGGYYSVDASAGKTFVIMNFTISNVSKESVEVDALSANPEFSACFKGSSFVNAETTFLTYSLSTYKDTLKAGASTDVVLLFAIKDSDAQDISNPAMKVKLDGKMYSVKI